jgi:hypothetical protein
MKETVKEIVVRTNKQGYMSFKEAMILLKARKEGKI